MSISSVSNWTIDPNCTKLKYPLKTGHGHPQEIEIEVLETESTHTKIKVIMYRAGNPLHVEGEPVVNELIVDLKLKNIFVKLPGRLEEIQETDYRRRASSADNDEKALLRRSSSAVLGRIANKLDESDGKSILKRTASAILGKEDKTQSHLKRTSSALIIVPTQNNSKLISKSEDRIVTTTQQGTIYFNEKNDLKLNVSKLFFNPDNNNANLYYKPEHSFKNFEGTQITFIKDYGKIVLALNDQKELGYIQNNIFNRLNESGIQATACYDLTLFIAQDKKITVRSLKTNRDEEIVFEGDYGQVKHLLATSETRINVFFESGWFLVEKKENGWEKRSITQLVDDDVTCVQEKKRLYFSTKNGAIKAYKKSSDSHIEDFTYASNKKVKNVFKKIAKKFIAKSYEITAFNVHELDAKTVILAIGYHSSMKIKVLRKL